MRAVVFRSFPRKRESRGRSPWPWVPASAGTNGIGGRAASFDHLVGAQQNRCRQLEAERLSGFEIDDKLYFGRLLDWKIGGLSTVEYLPCENTGLSVHIKVVHAIAY